ncbi:CcoQ/FixQ family Cbb3-type cytochrome c oxidase assembly chaperone [Porifericola rhodea]|uniref:CcoQ/FixQ family Cbb3-type cytochrome c oxidase assembly chaperone n=1 Tax=Porifericola rhodea TaxID=930972 RepID=UPI0026661C7F|nr:CcoQ/FixQ family Cbb3-type cytochrome c oxidase assembly chaperone [Porifericola rhodea]WKN31587.1 CcoQ/FixQ family Cbb3-type cytochrome c oxidase assembly chaperone [Porifericola rhodea]
MLKFIKYHMETIAGIEIYPLISFIIFFTFFLVLLLWVMRADKREIAEIASLPLDDKVKQPAQEQTKS